MVAHLRLVVPTSITPAAEPTEKGRLSFDDWYVCVELSQEGPAPVLCVWAQDEAGHPGGDTQLDLAGVDAFLGDLDGFRARVEELRALLAVETGGDRR